MAERAAAAFTVNGRFLAARPATGIQRVARSLLAHTRPHLGAELRVLAPSPVDDPLVDRLLGTTRGPVSGFWWEQGVLAIASRHTVTVSLANTGPLAVGRSAVLIHDLAPLIEPTWFHRRMVIYARVALAAARRADLVLAVSGHVADVLEAHGVSADRIAVLPPCVDDAFHPADADEVASVLDRLGLRPPYVVHVGSHDPRKNVDIVLRAHLAVIQSEPHQVVLVGVPHPNLAPVELMHAASVVAVGRLDDRSLRAVLSGAAALVYPSFEEGFGLPPLEAQACGTPAVVGDIAALRESAGPTALRVAPDDVPGWTGALLAAVRGELEPPTPPTGRWADRGAELARLLRAIG